MLASGFSLFVVRVDLVLIVRVDLVLIVRVDLVLIDRVDLFWSRSFESSFLVVWSRSSRSASCSVAPWTWSWSRRHSRRRAWRYGLFGYLRSACGPCRTEGAHGSRPQARARPRCRLTRGSSTQRKRPRSVRIACCAAFARACRCLRIVRVAQWRAASTPRHRHSGDSQRSCARAHLPISR